MRRLIVPLALIGLFTLPAIGQDTPPAAPNAPSADEPQRRRPRADGMPRGERRMDRGDRGGGRMIERLAERLELDEAQQAQFDDIMTAHRERMRALGEQRRAMREALDAGDEATVEKLRAEAEQSGGMQASIEQALDELEPVLRADQLATLDEIREQQRQRDGGREEYMRIVRELPDELKLDEAQRAQFDELVQARREGMRERFVEMRPLFEELRAAREAGDEARVAELTKEMEALRPSRENMLGEFFTALEGMLTDEQKVVLTAYREQLDAAGPGGRGNDATNLRALFRAATRLDLTAEQRDGLQEIQREATARLREAGRRDREGQALVIANAKERIVELLDPDQKAAFEQSLGRTSRRGR